MTLDAVPEDGANPQRRRSNRDAHTQRALQAARLEAQRRWRKANPGRVRQHRENAHAYRVAYDAAHREKILEQKRDAERRRTARIQADAQRVIDNRERARRWAAEHPDASREKSRRWAEQNPERRRELGRNYYERHLEERRRATREQNAKRRQDPLQREREREYRAEHRAHRNAQKAKRLSDPEARAKYNQEQNERRRRDRRLRRLGLPPRSTRRPTINEREGNQAAADTFFERRRTAPEVLRLRDEHVDVRVRAALAPEAFWEEELAVRIRDDAAKPGRIRAAVDELLATKAGPRLREEVRMDEIARRLRGAEPYPDAAKEVRRRALGVLAARRAQLEAAEHRPAPDPPSTGASLERPAIAS